MTQRDLQCVVIAGAAGLPGVERRKLILVVLIGGTGAVICAGGRGGTGACREAEHVRNLLCRRLISSKALIEIIHILGCGWRSRSARGAAIDSLGPGSERKHVLPVGNTGHAGIVLWNSCRRGLGEYLRSLEIIHAALRVNQIERWGQVDFLQQAMRETAGVGC